MNIADELFKEMSQANSKAKEASLRYNRLREEIIQAENENSDKTNRVTSKTIVQQQLDNRLETDKELKSYYSSYTFWTSEVMRISALIQGTLASKYLKHAIMSSTR